MKNLPMLSIIMPVYKAEQWLKPAIDSILQQTYRQFELILVDDAAPDCSGIICDEYIKKDSRIRVIHHPKNMGASAARNTGMDRCNR